MANLSFSQALEHIKNGVRMTRAAWREEHGNNFRFVVGMPELKLPPHNTQAPGPKVNDRTAQHIGADTPLDSRPYIAHFDGLSKIWQPGWLPSQEDLFAEDWCTHS